MRVLPLLTTATVLKWILVNTVLSYYKLGKMSKILVAMPLRIHCLQKMQYGAITHEITSMEGFSDFIIKFIHEKSIHTSEAIAVNYKEIKDSFDDRYYL